MRLLKRFFTSASRKYPSRPLLGVSVVIFKPNFESVVLVERGQEPKKGEWSFPGGLVNVGETIEEAAKREVFEEIGITDVNIITPHIGRFEGSPRQLLLILNTSIWTRKGSVSTTIYSRKYWQLLTLMVVCF